MWTAGSCHHSNKVYEKASMKVALQWLAETST